MDDKWFKEQQKKAGVTAEDIAREMGRDRSAVSHIYSGARQMSLPWARAFAKVLDVPLDEVLHRAGVLDEKPAQELSVGFAESDAVPFVGKAGEVDRMARCASVFGGDRAGVDVWTVKSGALRLGGYLPGDRILVDANQSELCKAGDIVIAQRYDWKTGTAATLLRRFEPPVLVAASAEDEDQRVLVVDGNNIVIKGRVVASWRT